MLKMGTALLIILVLGVLAIYWLRRHPEKVQAWLARRLMKNMQRRMQEEQRRQEEAYRRHREEERQQRQQPRSKHRREKGHSGPIIPPEYAQDVEFTESRVYSSDKEATINTDSKGNTRIKVEEQVSDVEWEDVRE